MKTLPILCAVCLFVGCQLTNNAPPPVTPAMTNAGQRDHADLATLNEGRRLFVSRCIECHTLPPHWHYSAKDWPGIVDSMAHRANLKRNERDAIVAYILAARRQ
jgi:mono/diheme cytochrome c family protein